MPLPKQEYKIFFFSNCGNGITENREKKSYEIYERAKRKLSCPQYFYNKSHMISYYQFKKICDKLIVAMALPKMGGKKIK